MSKYLGELLIGLIKFKSHIADGDNLWKTKALLRAASKLTAVWSAAKRALDADKQTDVGLAESVLSSLVFVAGWVVGGEQRAFKVHGVDNPCINESLRTVKLTFDHVTLFSAHIPYRHFICLQQDGIM